MSVGMRGSVTIALMSETSGVRGPALAVLIGGGALIAGSFMAWVEITSAFGQVSVDGIEKDGKITAVLGAAIGLIILTTMTARSASTFTGCAVIAAIAGAAAIYDWSSLNDAVDDASNRYARASVGDGLYLCIGGAGVAFVASLIGRSQTTTAEKHQVTDRF